jgi:mRNA-degrading endonuclease RelE of RelBE toxin-antitoxin system
MKPYKLLLVYEVVEFIESLSKNSQPAFHKRLRQIRDYPFNHSKISETDDDGRRVEINILGRYAIPYRIDDADGEVKVVEIILAGRGL